MQPLKLLSALRSIADATEKDCYRQEFKSNFIFQVHNSKLRNLSESITKDTQLNKAMKAKLLREINKMYLTSRNAGDYTFIRNEVKSKLLSLSSAVDFMKR